MNYQVENNLNDYSKLRRKMVKDQLEYRGITDKHVLRAMNKVPREKFIIGEYLDESYNDNPLPIGMGQTISQPYIVALMTECLELKGSEKVLEIGTGSGYQTAVLAEIVREVFSVEIIEDLYKRATGSLSAYKNIKLLLSDGYTGWVKYSPYDRIIVTAAPEHIPEELLKQLEDRGIMVIPIGPSVWNQTLYKIKKTEGRVTKERVCEVAFVPLVKEPGK